MATLWTAIPLKVARAAIAFLLLACALDGGNGPGPLPTPIATAAELRSLVGALAHDSMRGRRASSPEEQVATAYIASLAAQYGLVPSGGTSFFRDVPGQWRTVSGASVAVDEQSLTLWTDYVPALPRTSNPLLSWDAEAIYGGNFVALDQGFPPGVNVAGRAVVLTVPGGAPVFLSAAPGTPLGSAAVVILVGPSTFDPGLLSVAQSRRLLAGPAFRSTASAPVVLLMTPTAAERLIGASFAGMQPGHVGRRTRGTVQVDAQAAVMRNVVAVLPGTDAALANEYVAIGAHLDHVGVRQEGNGADSIYNGADDNASGSSALVMLARHFAQPTVRPRRSLLFIWFAAEELGLYGSEAFAHAPSIGLASMSAFVNLDMISRGGAADVVGGGTSYLQSIGSRRRSTQLGGIADSVASAHRFQLDYTYDAAGHEERVYCRSDHWNFARFGVPVVFFTTGGHEDYHRVTDEVDRSDFEKLARVTTFTAGVVQAIASRPDALARNLPAPDPNAACQQ